VWWYPVLRARERIRVQIVRQGRVVHDREYRVNTLNPMFLSRFRRELTETTDILHVKPIYVMTLGIDIGVATALVDSPPITSSDITIDDANLQIKVTKQVTVTATGSLYHVDIWCGTGNKEYILTGLDISPPVSVNANDVVTVIYTANYFISASNLTGILSDASITYANIVRRLYRRLANLTALCMRIAKVEYVDDAGTMWLSTTTQNNPDTATIKAPSTPAPASFNLKTVRLCASDGMTMISFVKATAIPVQANSPIEVTISVS
jgi:hypothetical protein